MGKGMTDHDAQAIAYLAGRLRQETYGAAAWDQAGIYAKVKELVGQNLELSLERILRHAADPEAKTPGAIHRPFLPPAPSEKPHGKRGNPTKADECPGHPGQWADNCGGCAADSAAGDPPPPRRTQGVRAPDEFRVARDAVRGA